jgi:hypothetical protein
MEADVKSDIQKSNCSDFHKAGGVLRDQSAPSWFFGASSVAKGRILPEIPRLRREKGQFGSET